MKKAEYMDNKVSLRFTLVVVLSVFITPMSNSFASGKQQAIKTILEDDQHGAPLRPLSSSEQEINSALRDNSTEDPYLKTTFQMAPRLKITFLTTPTSTEHQGILDDLQHQYGNPLSQHLYGNPLSPSEQETRGAKDNSTEAPRPEKHAEDRRKKLGVDLMKKREEIRNRVEDKIRTRQKELKAQEKKKFQEEINKE